MRCRHFRALHLQFVDGHLASAKADAMWNHLEACAPCAQFDAAVRRSLLVARNLPRVRVSVGFNSRLSARLRDTMVEPPRRYAPAGLRYGVAAAVVLVGAVILWSQRPLSDARLASPVAAATTARTNHPERNPARESAPATPVATAAPEFHVSAQFAAGLATGVAVWPGVLMADRTAHEMREMSPAARSAP